ncbi:MAG: type 1 glutamine amidotransferase [Pseudomonadota bacterium]
MKIAVLDLTTHPAELAGFPRVWEQIVAWLSPALPEAEMIPFDVAQGGAPLPKPADFDGLLLSGSEFGVYDDTPWMAPLRQLLLDTKAAGKPIYGICFGHQLMADTFGGKAEKAVQGNQLGARSFDLGGTAASAMVWHQDQVTAVPAGATVTGSASYCPVGALAYDFPAASVQFHPEYREPHLRQLYDIFLGSAVTAEERATALASFDDHTVAHDLQAQETAAFLRKHAPAAASS